MQKHIVYTTIIDYSRKEIIKDKAEIMWSVAGSKNRNHLALKQVAGTNNFSAEIPWQKKALLLSSMCHQYRFREGQKHNQEQRLKDFIHF